MATSQRTVEQVRTILGKLGRNIDQLREQRLGVSPTPAAPGLGALPVGTPVRPAAPIPAPAAQYFGNAQSHSPQNGSAAPGPLASKYGRAQPIRD